MRNKDIEKLNKIYENMKVLPFKELDNILGNLEGESDRAIKWKKEWEKEGQIYSIIVYFDKPRNVFFGEFLIDGFMENESYDEIEVSSNDIDELLDWINGKLIEKIHGEKL